MKLTTKQFKQRYSYWIPFAKAFYLFTQCEYDSIFRVSAVFTDKTHITSYFALYPDTYVFPFDRLDECLIHKYKRSDYLSDLSNLLSFIHSLNIQQFTLFIGELRISSYPCKSYISFLTDKFHEK